MSVCRHASGSLLLAAAALAWAAAPAARADGATPGVQIVRAAAIADKIESAPPSPGGRGGVIAQDGGWRVHVAERDAPGQAEMHDGDADVWYVLAGAATLVTGGTLVDATTTGPGERRGSAIRGGAETAISAGDLVSIRPGVPHWVKAVNGRLRYLTVKVHGCPAPAGARAREGSHQRAIHPAS
jgi:mannose-6-phosphate isomerase-like protein (cupin superfamily)